MSRPSVGVALSDVNASCARSSEFPPSTSGLPKGETARTEHGADARERRLVDYGSNETVDLAN